MAARGAPGLALGVLLALLAAGCTLPGPAPSGSEEAAPADPGWRAVDTPVLIEPAAPRPPRERPPDPGWPVEGSFLRYEAATTSPTGADANVSYELRHENGTWRATCRAPADEAPRSVALGPPTGPRETRVGDRALVRTLTGDCARRDEPLRVTGRQNYTLALNGTAARVVAWHAEEGPWSAPHDALEALWDPATGVVLQWELHEARGRIDHGRLVATDAPLSAA